MSRVTTASSSETRADGVRQSCALPIKGMAAKKGVAVATRCMCCNGSSAEGFHAWPGLMSMSSACTCALYGVRVVSTCRRVDACM